MNYKYLFVLLGLIILMSFQSGFNSFVEKDIIVVFKKQADISIASSFYEKEDKALYVLNTTKEIAIKNQEVIINFLNKRNIRFQSFHVINAIKVFDANDELIKKLKSFDEVDYVQDDSPVKLEHDGREYPSSGHTRDVEWGLDKIGVDKVWEEWNVKGAGVIIAGQDTGYDWKHPALKDKYKGWNGVTANHNYHWHDAIHDYNPLHETEENSCGLDVMEPCDDSRHGTHTMGTMVGSAPDEEIGVAPDAKWIACRNMDRGWGKPSTYIECFEWFLAPTDLNGNNPDVSKSPHVIANSWGCPESEGCNPDNFNTMKIVVDNLKASGVVVVVSAGNGGNNGCETVSAPAAIFESSFSIGASDVNDTLANFSSRGAVMVDGSQRIKPNVSAPGVNVRSCTPNNNYASFSGTSMAGPHVAGVVALMISANPKLAGQVEQIETILEQTAVPIAARMTDECNDTYITDIPNNIFGYGRIDAYAAVKAARENAFDYNEKEVFVYPNPSTGAFQLLIPDFLGDTKVRIWNASGKLMLDSSVSFEIDGFSLDLSRFSSGVYFYQISQGESKRSGKLLKL
ncbi:MAG: serine protease AprX [Maribacter sp.]|jgi:serine protease AprX